MTAALRRLAASLVTVLLATLLVFVLVRAVPGDIVTQMLGQSADGEISEQALRAFFGLDQPWYRQYLAWLGDALRGDLGVSWQEGRPVAGLVGEAFLVTLQLALLTLLFATALGVPLGLAAGIWQGRWPDHLVQALNIAGLSAPVFWVGLMLLIGASAAFGWGPPIRYRGPAESLSDNLQILLLPVLSLGLLQAAAYSQFVRQTVISVVRQDFVRTARAKGLGTARIYGRHVLRNVLIPLVTFMGLVLVQILGGVVIIESLFALPGIGRLLLTAIQTRDYPVVQGALLLVVVVAIVVNLAVDLLYRRIDPRLRVRPA